MRGVIRHASQESVHGKDDAEQVHRVEDAESCQALIGCRLDLVNTTTRDAGAVDFEIAALHQERERGDTRQAARAHPTAEPPQILPHPVSVHVFAAAPPQQQPIIEKITYGAEHGGKSANENLSKL